MRGSRGRGGTTSIRGSLGIRSEDGAAALDRGFARSFLCTSFGFISFNSIAALRGDSLDKSKQRRRLYEGLFERLHLRYKSTSIVTRLPAPCTNELDHPRSAERF